MNSYAITCPDCGGLGLVPVPNCVSGVTDIEYVGCPTCEGTGYIFPSDDDNLTEVSNEVEDFFDMTNLGA